jgi:hypothetical protein
VPLDIRVDDVLQLKKPHPCGENAWHVYRVGADIGLRCAGCQRMVLLPRSAVERQVRRVTRGGEVLKPDALRS